MSQWGEFLTKLRAEWDEEELEWRLLEPLVYRTVGGWEIEVPADFLTDLASFPITMPRTHGPAVVHDYLYRVLSQETLVTREMADNIFYEAMRASDIGWFAAWRRWLGVRLFGGDAWRGGNGV